MKWFFVYLIIVNIITFIVFAVDKNRAKRHAWRVPEKTLFMLAVIGGSIGANFGMYLCHHKTKHWYFVIGMPAISAVQIMAVLFILQRSGLWMN